MLVIEITFRNNYCLLVITRLLEWFFNLSYQPLLLSCAHFLLCHDCSWAPWFISPITSCIFGEAERDKASEGKPKCGHDMHHLFQMMTTAVTYSRYFSLIIVKTKVDIRGCLLHENKSIKVHLNVWLLSSFITQLKISTSPSNVGLI
jgi:hypothetical protein